LAYMRRDLFRSSRRLLRGSWSPKCGSQWRSWGHPSSQGKHLVRTRELLPIYRWWVVIAPKRLVKKLEKVRETGNHVLASTKRWEGSRLRHRSYLQSKL